MRKLCNKFLLSTFILLATAAIANAKLWYELLPAAEITLDSNMSDWASIKSVDISHGPNTATGIVDVKFARSDQFLYWYADIGANSIASDTPLTLVFTGPGPDDNDTALFVKYHGNGTFSYYEARYIEHAVNGMLETEIGKGGPLPLPESDGLNISRTSNIIEGSIPFTRFDNASYEDIEIGFFTELDFQDPARGILSYLTPYAKVYSVNRGTEFGTAVDIDWEWEFFDQDISALNSSGAPENLFVEFVTPVSHSSINFSTPAWEFDDGKGGGQYFYSGVFAPEQGAYVTQLTAFNTRTLTVQNELGIERIRQLPVVDSESIQLEQISSDSIRLSWLGVNYNDAGPTVVPLYYRVKVYDDQGNCIAKSGREPYLTATEFTFNPQGNEVSSLSFKIQVYDGEDYDEMMNMSTTGRFQMSNQQTNLVPVLGLLFN